MFDGGWFIPSQFSIGGQFGDYQVVIGGPGGLPGGSGTVVYQPGPVQPVYQQGQFGAVPPWIWIALLAVVAFAVLKK